MGHLAAVGVEAGREDGQALLLREEDVWVGGGREGGGGGISAASLARLRVCVREWMGGWADGRKHAGIRSKGSFTRSSAATGSRERRRGASPVLGRARVSSRELRVCA